MAIHTIEQKGHVPEHQAAPAAAPPEGAVEKLQVKIGGMSCSFCVSTIEKGVSRIDGVLDVKVNLTHEEALITFDPARAKPSEIKETIQDLGYTVRDPNKVRSFEEEEADLRTERNNLILVSGIAAVSMITMTLMWLALLPMQQASPFTLFTLWLMPTLALSTVFGPGWHFLSVAWSSLRRRILNQHVLLEFGAFAGLIGGFLGYISPAFPAPDFFGVAVFITTYHILASYISLLIRTRSSQAVSKLLQLVPATARVVRDGQEEEVPIEEVRVGDIVRIRPGESISVDGEVVEGTSGVDLSLVTGESIPVEVNKGDEVIGGAVNQNGSLLVSVTRVGSESFLQQVARQIEEARALKPGILALVDRILQVFVPTVLAFAGGAILIWTLGAWLTVGSADWISATFAALAVLVMGYPCAMGMATPLAMIRGGGMAARKGILMRSAEAFQVLKEVRKVVLDKTGTITRGKPAVVKVVPLAGHQESEVLRLAAGIESASEHPLAQAVVNDAKERNLSVPQAREFQAQPGKGVRAQVEEHRVAIGSPKFIEGEGVDLKPARPEISALQAAGNTVVVLAIDGKEAGLIAIADPIKPDAREAIARMHDAGLEPVMLTGDNALTAEVVARQVGITEYRAEVLPQAKSQAVRDFQQQGHRVMMVGDGINDAPALMQADVGIAMGAGTDIAIESADIVLIGERLGAVIDAYHIGIASYRKTVQNLSLAFAFNGIGVPLAVTGLVHPVWAMVAMAASITAVLANSFGGRMLPKARRGREAQLTLNISNMHCQNCVVSIQKAVGKLKGVGAVTGDLEQHLVTIDYREGMVEPDGIREAIVERGFLVA